MWFPRWVAFSKLTWRTRRPLSQPSGLIFSCRQRIERRVLPTSHMRTCKQQLLRSIANGRIACSTSCFPSRPIHFRYIGKVDPNAAARIHHASDELRCAASQAFSFSGSGSYACALFMQVRLHRAKTADLIQDALLSDTIFSALKIRAVHGPTSTQDNLGVFAERRLIGRISIDLQGPANRDRGVWRERPGW